MALGLQQVTNLETPAEYGALGFYKDVKTGVFYYKT